MDKDVEELGVHTQPSLKKLILYVATALIVVLNILDIIVTLYVFSLGGIEANPLTSFLFTYNLLIPLKLAVVGFIAGGTWLRRHQEVMTSQVVLACIAASIYVGVVGWNVSRIFVHLA